MQPVRAHVLDGRIVVQPTNLPDGAEVDVAVIDVDDLSAEGEPSCWHHWTAPWMIRKQVEGSTSGSSFERTARDVKILIPEEAQRQVAAKCRGWRSRARASRADATAHSPGTGETVL
jgi:hypothetical protein